jgi:mRNA-degrading endonuclease RelE of RelBE toxin-antitoxin system
MIVSLSPRALKDIKDLDPVIRQRVARKIEDIQQDRAKPEPLTGDLAGFWKVYVGLRWRILLEISPDYQTAIIVKVAPRRESYR